MQETSPKNGLPHVLVVVVLVTIILVLGTALAITIHGYKRELSLVSWHWSNDRERLAAVGNSPKDTRMSLVVGDVSIAPLTFELKLSGVPIDILPSYGVLHEFNQQNWFYKTTDDDIVVIHNSPDTWYPGELSSVYLNEAERKSIKLSDSLMFNGSDRLEAVFTELTGDEVVGFTKTSTNHSVTTNFKDLTVCATMPESVYWNPDWTADESSASVSAWLDDCNTRYPLSVSRLLVDGKVEVTFPRKQIIREMGLEGQVVYSFYPLERDQPGLNLEALGVAPDLEKAYFQFDGVLYMIDGEGRITNPSYEEVDIVQRTY